MLTLLKIEGGEITGWILAEDRDHLVGQMLEIDRPDKDIMDALERIGEMPIDIPYGKHAIQPGFYLLSSL